MTKEGWFKYTICEQMSNIAADVHHFIEARANFKNGTSSTDYSDFYFDKVISYINIIEEDPKNVRRIPELEDCKKELEYLKAGIFSEEYITSYWDQYTEACSFRTQH